MFTLPTFQFEKELWNKGYDLVIGVDEVGRGCFAGPIVASACAFAKLEVRSEKLEVIIDDSKRLKPQERRKSAMWIKKNCLAYGIGEVSVATINKVGIGKATQQAMRLAIATLLHCYIAKIANNITIKQSNNWFVLVDAFYLPYTKGIPVAHQKPIVRGDQKSISIAAASIVAKVYRDKLMQQLSKRYTYYGWGRNKGYGTKFHQEAIKKNGVTKLHRIMFVETFLRAQGLALQG